MEGASISDQKQTRHFEIDSATVARNLARSICSFWSPSSHRRIVETPEMTGASGHVMCSPLLPLFSTWLYLVVKVGLNEPIKLKFLESKKHFIHS